jgi:hypothetical protein
MQAVQIKPLMRRLQSWTGALPSAAGPPARLARRHNVAGLPSSQISDMEIQKDRSPLPLVLCGTHEDAPTTKGRHAHTVSLETPANACKSFIGEQETARGSTQDAERIARLSVSGRIQELSFRRQVHRTPAQCVVPARRAWERIMHSIIYLVGLVVVILAILSFFGLR